VHVHLLDPPAYTRPYDHALARALGERGVTVTLITSRFAYATSPEPERYRLEESFYRGAVGPPGSRRRALSGLVSHLPGMVAYRRASHRRPPDLLHVQWLSLPALDLALLRGRPIVLTLHDPGVAAARGRFGVPSRALRAMDAIIVHSASARHELSARVPDLDVASIHVIAHGPLGCGARPGFDSTTALPAELSASAASGRPVVLFFGLLRAYKGLDTLLAAWPEVAEAELWIVGRPLEGTLAPVPDAGAQISVVPRFVSEAEQRAIFAAADLVVLPYHDAGRHSSSGVLATALGTGRAVIASEIPGFSEVIAAGGAHPVPPGQPRALAAALNELIADPTRREQLATAGAGLAGADLSWAQAAARTETVYHQVLAR
jgi:glycosyltransferase involved in cell wall biosynthesis